MSIAARISSKIRRTSRQLYRDLWHGAGFDRSFYRKSRGSRILIYHGICQTHHTRFNPIFLTQKIFEEHLKYYRKYFNVISLNDYYQQKFSADKFNISLTFDDGFANNYRYVLPLLEKYQLPATFFITAIRQTGQDILWNDFLSIAGKFGPQQVKVDGNIYSKGKFNKYYTDGQSLNDLLRADGFAAKINAMYQLRAQTNIDWKSQEDYWLQMTCEQIKSLSQSPYATIGAHGHYHNDLAKVSLADAANELAISKSWLEDLTGNPVNSFAFPYGSYTRAAVDAAKKAGYTQLLAMDYLFAEDTDDATMRERFTVNPFISSNNQMHATINRRYDA